MLIQFSVANFKTFKEKATLSFIASNYDKDTRENENVVLNERYNLRILKSAVIYGANASGKSKFMDAIKFMRNFSVSSSKETQNGDEIAVEPFRLSNETENEPSEFEVIFIHKNVYYRYGFEVNKKHVVSEWLYYKPRTKEIEVYYRDFQKFEIHERRFAKGLTVVKERLVRNNALLLSVAAQFNDSISLNVIQWFKSLGVISGLKEEGYTGYTVGRSEDRTEKTKILELLKAADLEIVNVEVQKLDLNALPKNMPKELKEMILEKSKDEDTQFFSDVLTTRKKYDKNDKSVGTVTFSMDEDESSGTKKFFAFIGPILDVVENGFTLIVDELDSKLHPNLVCKIVSIFNSKELNPNNAQLLFNTHDTNLLSSHLFRRDQIWFTEKGKIGGAKLYSLGDFKSDEVRKGEPFEENYIRGKYGAVPFLGTFNKFIHHDLSALIEDEK